jgi:predicted nucleotidyltransferase component of viral defense system
MISRAYITAWGKQARWPDENQIEQDLILSRLLVEIAAHPLLSEELAFRGGTCLHKLHLPEPLHYSEDLDFVRTNQEPALGKIFEELRGIAAAIGCRRDNAFRECIFLPYSVDSPWWSGSTEVRTFNVEEILATKVRALCERRKGRDLFDLWIGLNRPEIKDQTVADALKHYMGENVFSYPQLAQRLASKLGDPEFEADLGALVTEVPAAYEQAEAVDMVRRRIGLKLRNVPKDVLDAEGLT